MNFKMALFVMNNSICQFMYFCIRNLDKIDEIWLEVCRMTKAQIENS